ncbi:hypothetical protein [Streptomyces sp. ISL-100]|uniref:hypothetical protein n=1 Tax=Streptomyces sp. ISL-100 TaxID=2819173 RepID=UPI001BEB121B|nr:hypothetical protein [Streptomyces sp. ISL-100]MBT2401221.1 hypothetical protein [Streptomyces sp. ISL-100]
MSDGGGYRADTESLGEITKGINLAMDELKELGFDVDANLGRGFDDLQLAGLELGDKPLQEIFAEFCDRWGWGVRTLMQDANTFAAGLGLNAGLYHEEERYNANTFKTVWNQVAGNPYASQEEIESQSVKETILKGNAIGHFMDADYSAQSIVEAERQKNEANDQLAEDFETSTWNPWQDDTEWQWDGPPQAEQSPAEGAAGGER